MLQIVLASSLLAFPPGLLEPSQDAGAFPPDTEQLVASGWQLIPPYAGDHRPSVDPDTRQRTMAASHLFAAAEALQPGHLRSLWSRGHAEVLLAEDARSRGLDPAPHVANIEDCLGRAIEQHASDPWVRYARGAVRTTFAAPLTALEDLDMAAAYAGQQAAALAEQRPDKEEDPEVVNILWLRFKALEWRPEVFMRAGQFEQAREALNSFHEEFSENAFPRHIALAESYLRQRDFAGARGEYEAILEAFPNDYQAYSLLGYLAGLQGDRAAATQYLRDATRRELAPGMYTRLWLWILATEEALPAAEEDLRGFLTHPPSSLSAWDRQLGWFCLGEEDPRAFLERAQQERTRRLDAGEAMDELLAEVLYYIGLRHELDARAASEESLRQGSLQAALAAYTEALAFQPVLWKWEWAFARYHYAGLAKELGLEPAAQPVEASTAGWQQCHRPGEAQASAGERLDRLPGDLHLGLRDGRFRFELVTH